LDNKARKVSDGIYFNNRDGNRILFYDISKEEYVKINSLITSGSFDAEGKRVCFLSSDSNVYCHVYDENYDYSQEGEIHFGNKVIGGYDFANDDDDPMDDYGHGTHVAATAAWNGLLKGVAPDAEILAYKVLEGWGWMSWIASAMEDAFLKDADIISMSLGDPFCLPDCSSDDFISKISDDAVDAGMVVVVAAGNEGYEGLRSPGTARKVITIGAVDKSKNLAYFSAIGPVVWVDEDGSRRVSIKPDVVAPGVNICAAVPGGKRSCYSGTSMATPHVSGAVALLLQKNPDWTPSEVKAALKNTASDLGFDLFEQGRGMIDISKAIQLNGKQMVAEISDLKYDDSFDSIEIMGTAKGDEFVGYNVYYSEIGREDWELVCSGRTLVDNSILCSVSGKVAKGDYDLMLAVEGKDSSSVGFGRTMFFEEEVVPSEPEKEPEPYRPPSEITNWGTSDVEGRLVLALEEKVLDEWRLFNSVYSNKFILPALTSYDLSSLWNSQNVSVDSLGLRSQGEFRVYAGLWDDSGQVMIDSNGKKIEAYSKEFRVVS